MKENLDKKQLSTNETTKEIRSKEARITEISNDSLVKDSVAVPKSKMFFDSFCKILNEQSCIKPVQSYSETMISFFSDKKLCKK